MASSSSEASSPMAEEGRNWLELPRDVTASILSRVGAFDILTSAQMVCKPWLQICNDPLMWRTIDMPNFDYFDEEFDFERMCREAVDRSRGQLLDINIEYFGTNHLLQYIAERSSQLKRLRLACCNDFSNKGLIKAIEKLPLLEDLDLTHFSVSVDLLKALGRSCPDLKSMKLNGHASKVSHLDPVVEKECNGVVVAICENMPTLRHLQLIGNSMTDMGLEAILDCCSKLESLDLRRCVNIDFDGNLKRRCAEQIKHLRLPNDSMKDCGFFDDLDDFEDDPFSFADEDFLFGKYLQLDDDFDYLSGDDSFDYDDFTNPFKYDDFTNSFNYDDFTNPFDYDDF